MDLNRRVLLALSPEEPPNLIPFVADALRVHLSFFGEVPSDPCPFYVIPLNKLLEANQNKLPSRPEWPGFFFRASSQRAGPRSGGTLA